VYGEQEGAGEEAFVKREMKREEPNDRLMCSLYELNRILVFGRSRVKISTQIPTILT
jgi:hypothetical protein